jgi:hypothetical protein
MARPLGCLTQHIRFTSFTRISFGNLSYPETLGEILANLERKMLHYENHGGVTTK